MSNNKLVGIGAARNENYSGFFHGETIPEREKRLADAKRNRGDVIIAIGMWLSAALEDDGICAEMKDDIRKWFALGCPTSTSDDSARLVASLADMIGRISSALSISEEDQAIASGDEEILSAIEDLRANEVRFRFLRRSVDFAVMKNLNNGSFTPHKDGWIEVEGNDLIDEIDAAMAAQEKANVKS